MQNDFERQVQQKMEELDLVPSAPVWEKIESQISDKKDRRRYVLWFFLLCLLLGGGVTWLSLQSDDLKDLSKTESQYEHNENKSSNTTSNPQTSPSIKNQTITDNENPTVKEIQTITQTEETKNSIAPEITEKNIEPQSVNNSVVINSKNKDSKKINSSKQKVVVVSDIPSNSISSNNKKLNFAKTEKNKTVIAPVVNKVITSESKIPVETNSVTPVNPTQQKTTQPVKKSTDTAEAKKPATVNAVVSTDPLNKNEVIADNTLPAADSVSKPTDVVLAKPKTKNSKWQFGISASVGVSGLGEGLSLSEATNEKSLRDAFSQAFPASYTRVPYSRGYTPPSVVKKNVAYSISAVVRRVIGKKTQISTGVGYDHYSTLLESGRMDSANTLVGSSGNSFSASGTFKNYSNKFYFITVPLNIHFQVFKKTPLNLYGGIAFKHMVATNAMEYNHLTYTYSGNINDYIRTQVFSNFGIEYALVNKKNQLLVGPEITYGISKHLQTGSPQHLYSIGIKANYLFQKN